MTTANMYDKKETTDNYLNHTNKERLKTVFGHSKTVLALKQPRNLLLYLTSASFSSDIVNQGTIPSEDGLYTFDCNDKRCNLCNKYIVQCKSFVTANKYIWEIRGHINCKSKNVIYYLVCSACNIVSYTGKTNAFRLRMNNHISACRLGTSSDRFDNHVYNCCRKENYNTEPYFKIFTFMELKNEHLLLTYEAYLHQLGYDTMNC